MSWLYNNNNVHFEDILLFADFDLSPDSVICVQREAKGKTHWRAKYTKILQEEDIINALMTGWKWYFYPLDL